jgi:predicted secreted acid phosphatase
MSRRIAVPLICVLATAFAAVGVATAAKPPAPPQARAVVVDYYDSGQWTRDVVAQTKKARKLLKRGLAHVDRGKKPAIVLDIDDTSLTQYPCRKPGDLPFDDGAAGASCVASGRLPAIVETRAIYRLAQRRGVRVFLITGRPTPARDATVANLREAGYTGRYKLILRPVSDLSAPSVIPYKSGERRKIVRAGYDILLNIGDQYSDLRGGFADHRIKLPNPMYFIA